MEIHNKAAPVAHLVDRFFRAQRQSRAFKGDLMSTSGAWHPQGYYCCHVFVFFCAGVRTHRWKRCRAYPQPLTSSPARPCAKSPSSSSRTSPSERLCWLAGSPSVTRILYDTRGLRLPRGKTMHAHRFERLRMYRNQLAMLEMERHASLGDRKALRVESAVGLRLAPKRGCR